MSASLSESKIVEEVARQASRRVTRRVIAALQKMKVTLSGEDSELKTTWDEICVQVQDGDSYEWDAYEQTIRALVFREAAGLPEHEREAIWLQTEEGYGWPWGEEARREANPVVTDDIVKHLVSEYVYEEAARWSNARIRAHIERSGMTD